MEDQIYMTDNMTHKKIKEFEEWFDKYIGTEIEVEDFGENEWSATCFDLNMSEVKKCRNWENGNGL